MSPHPFRPCWLVLALLLVLLPGCAHLPATSAETRDLVYAERDGHPLKLDLYLPEMPPPKGGYPLIICFHGGGWIIKGKTDDLFLKPLLQQGYALASVQYRLSSRASFPAQIEDARDALHWLIAQAPRYRLDRERIGAFGPSAGGHLALLLGLGETKRFGPSAPFPQGTIKAICALYPPTDLVEIIPPKNRDHKSNLVAKLLGGSVTEKMALAVEGSPATYVTKSAPPILLIHGRRDSIVPLEQSRHLHALMGQAGASSRLIVLPDGMHAFGLNAKLLAYVQAFYDRNLK